MILYSLELVPYRGAYVITLQGSDWNPVGSQPGFALKTLVFEASDPSWSVLFVSNIFLLQVQSRRTEVL